MVTNKKKQSYDAPKEFEGQTYTGMRVGGKHGWNYNNGKWNETKVSPDKWLFEFACNKERRHQAPPGTGASIKTEYHWYIIANQNVVKLDENTYSTVMKGSKFKIGYKRPNWNIWNYGYKRVTPEDLMIEVLQATIEKLKQKKKERELLKFL